MAASIAIEGPEGGGKSKLFWLTKELLMRTAHVPVLAVREPGGTVLGETKIRPILKDPDFKNLHPVTNVLLFSSARSELYFKEEIPFLEKNSNGVLLKERSWLSTDCHQGADGAQVEYIDSVQVPFKGLPDKFAIIDIPVEETILRMIAAQRDSGSREVDWRDLLDPVDLGRVRSNYLDYAQRYPGRCVVLDCFDDPWVKAAKIKYEILRILGIREGRPPSPSDEEEMVSRYRNEAKEIVDTTCDFDGINYVKVFDINKLREQVELIRAEMNYPSKVELQERMHTEWRARGIEGYHPEGRISRERQV